MTIDQSNQEVQVAKANEILTDAVPKFVEESSRVREEARQLADKCLELQKGLGISLFDADTFEKAVKADHRPSINATSFWKGWLENEGREDPNKKPLIAFLANDEKEHDVEIDIITELGLWRITLGEAYERGYRPEEVRRMPLDANEFVDDLFWFAVTQIGEGLDKIKDPNGFRAKQLQSATQVLVDAIENIGKERSKTPQITK
jgi:hypothetical protein